MELETSHTPPRVLDRFGGPFPPLSRSVLVLVTELHHRGLDFIPGNGAPIFAIADGVVTASEYGGGYGQYVYIEHSIGGQTVLSVYAHMQRGSSPVQQGQTVSAGEFLGLVGNTGISTGAHLHFEIRIDGEYANPFTWLKAKAF
jgi:murein DD-endopeptidase MepM/ murein hydrolase activator NlpD